MRHQYGLDQLSTAGDDWRTRAACIGHDPELFFPPNEATDSAQIAAAKAVCNSCPVVSDCLRWALDKGEDFGVWAATTSTERRNIRKGLQSRPNQPKQAEPQDDVSGICMVCDAPFTTVSTSGRMYCSNRCNQAAHRQRKKIVEGAPA